jgi:hypothetical protein
MSEHHLTSRGRKRALLSAAAVELTGVPSLSRIPAVTHAKYFPLMAYFPTAEAAADIREK